jgi:probable HAF family extracellular repeat protein
MRTTLAMLFTPVVVGLLWGGAAPARADGYVVHDLGTLSSWGWQPEVVGGHYIAPVFAEEVPWNEPERYVILSANVDLIASLGTLGGDRTVAYAENDQGEVAGISDVPPIITPEFAAFPHHAFKVLPGGQMIDLGTFTPDPRLSSTAFGISADGRVVGRAAVDAIETPEFSAFPQHAFLHDGQSLLDLGTLTSDPTLSSTAYALNSAGQVVGSAATSLVFSPDGVAAPQHAFVWQGGLMHDLGTLSTDLRLSSFAYGINDVGQVVGTSAHSIAKGDGWEKVVQRAFLYTAAGGLHDLGTLGGYDSFGYAIDAAGRIVGKSSLASATGFPWDEEVHAVVWEDGQMTDLGGLAAGRRSAAYGFDTDGRIHGLAYDADWNLHLVTWEPAATGPGSNSHSGLGDGTNPGQGAGLANSPNTGTGNPATKP